MASIGLNALVLRTDASYRNAGPSRYTRNLVEQIIAASPALDFTVFVNDQVSELPFTPTRPIQLRRTRASTSRTGIRILWEHFVAPWHIAISRLDLVHSMLNVVPVASPTKHVVTIHDLSFMQIAAAHPPLRRWYLTAATWLSVRRAAAVLADSIATRNDVIKLLGADPRKVHVLYPGVEPDFHPRSGNEINAFRHNVGQHRPFILFVGTLEPRKNVDILVQAFGSIIRDRAFDGDLVLAGGRGWGMEAIDSAIAQSPVRDRIREIGYVNERDLPFWYNSADLVVYPSSFEGFGFPVLEAMASGTPVITSNRSSLPEVIGNAGLMTEPRDTAQLAAAMSSVLTSPQRRKAMRRQGLVQANQFDWSQAAKKCLNIYQHILKPR